MHVHSVYLYIHYNVWYIFSDTENIVYTIARKPGSGHPSNHVRRIVEQKMRQDDETTATQLHELLIRNGISISLRTVLRCREQLGWAFRGSAYCQLI